MTPRPRARLWPHLVLGLVALLGWTILVQRIPQWVPPKPASTALPLIGPPLALILLTYGHALIRNTVRNNRAQAKAEAEEAAQRHHEEQAEAHRTFSLEVLGQGAQVGGCTPPDLVQHLDRNRPRPSPPCQGAPSTLQALAASLAQTIPGLPHHWPLPTFLVGPPAPDGARSEALDMPIELDGQGHLLRGDPWMVHHLEAAAQLAGTPPLRLHSLVQGSSGEALMQGFAWLESHPEVPAILVCGLDGPEARQEAGWPVDPGRGPDCPQAFAALIGHRTRLAALRTHRRVDRAREARKPAWERDLPETDFRPTPWIPHPWSIEELEPYEQLRPLGHLHRPIGQQETPHVRSLGQAWQALLSLLPPPPSAAERPPLSVFQHAPSSKALMEQAFPAGECPVQPTFHDLRGQLTEGCLGAGLGLALAAQLPHPVVLADLGAEAWSMALVRPPA